MADCVRCEHPDTDHEETAGGGLGGCTQNDACVIYMEAVTAEIPTYFCGLCGVLLADMGPHTEWHVAQ